MDDGKTSLTSGDDASAHTSRGLSTDTPTSSLDILNPAPWVPRDETRERTQAQTTLEQLSKSLIDVFCNLDFDNPLMQYATPNFVAYIDYNSSQVRSLDEHIEFHKWMVRNNPGYVYEVVSVSADVDEQKGLASVWALLRVTGHPIKIARESMTILFWRRKQGTWRCYKQFGLRGVGWS